MLSLDLARQLSAAGLAWTPTERDTFIVPDSDMDQKVFVISDLATWVQSLAGIQHITFHGTSEWALDHVMVRDAIWVPSETQLRSALEERIPFGEYVLERQPEGYRCVIVGATGNGVFHPSAEDAYAVAVLHLLQGDSKGPDGDRS